MLMIPPQNFLRAVTAAQLMAADHQFPALLSPGSKRLDLGHLQLLAQSSRERRCDPRSAKRVEMLRTAADGGNGGALPAVMLDRVDAAAASLIEDMEDKEQIPDR